MEAQAQDYRTTAKPGTDSEKSDTDFGRVIDAFRARGTSVLAWSKAHGWARQTVYHVIEAWVENPQRRGRMPLGGVSRAVIAALHEELGEDIVPLTDSTGRAGMGRIT